LRKIVIKRLFNLMALSLSNKKKSAEEEYKFALSRIERKLFYIRTTKLNKRRKIFRHIK